MTNGPLLRSFLALEIPSGLQRLIADRTAPVRRALPSPLVRWVAAENIHLTVKFLGDVSPANLTRLAEALQREAAGLPAFPVQVGGLGAFPNTRRARVLWIGLQPPAELFTLQRLTESLCERLGYEREARPFSAHLTIGRVGQHAGPGEHARIHQALEQVQIDLLGSPCLDALCIFKSELRPTGSVYTRLYRLPLAAVAHPN
jgi:2'-5' RNA ligase